MKNKTTNVPIRVCACKEPFKNAILEKTKKDREVDVMQALKDLDQHVIQIIEQVHHDN